MGHLKPPQPLLSRTHMSTIISITRLVSASDGVATQMDVGPPIRKISGIGKVFCAECEDTDGPAESARASSGTSCPYSSET